MTNRLIKAFRGSAKDQIKFELIKGALTGARREMEALITRTSMSPFIREKKDFFTAILNRDGELVVSTSLTLAGNLLDSVLETYPIDTMLDGDIYWYNDPYYTKGAVSHLPDMVFIMPVFSSDRLTAFVECWGHSVGYWRFRTWVDKPICNFSVSRRHNDTSSSDCTKWSQE
jgi:N-methylhydantoinase B